MSSKSGNVTDAIFLYLGILDAYEAISTELIGENVLEEEVLPRMVYYVENFLPDMTKGKTETEIIVELTDFINNIRETVYSLHSSSENASSVSMDDVWEIRAAIFGFENVFLDILGKDVIETYVNPRIGEILNAYLPDILSSKDMTIQEKLQNFSTYIKDSNFVKDANFTFNEKSKKVEYRVNRCAFAVIHNSSAYLDGQTRFCPWGMIASAISSSAINTNFNIEKCTFTTRGSITKLKMYKGESS